MLKPAHIIERENRDEEFVKFHLGDIDLEAIQEQLAGPLAAEITTWIRRALDAGELVIEEGEVVWAER